MKGFIKIVKDIYSADYNKVALWVSVFLSICFGIAVIFFVLFLMALSGGPTNHAIDTDARFHGFLMFSRAFALHYLISLIIVWVSCRLGRLGNARIALANIKVIIVMHVMLALVFYRGDAYGYRSLNRVESDIIERIEKDCECDVWVYFHNDEDREYLEYKDSLAYSIDLNYYNKNFDWCYKESKEYNERAVKYADWLIDDFDELNKNMDFRITFSASERGEGWESPVCHQDFIYDRSKKILIETEKSYNGSVKREKYGGAD